MLCFQRLPHQEKTNRENYVSHLTSSLGGIVAYHWRCQAFAQLCPFCSPDRRKESANLCYRDFSPTIRCRLHRGDSSPKAPTARLRLVHSVLSSQRNWRTSEQIRCKPLAGSHPQIGSLGVSVESCLLQVRIRLYCVQS